MTPWSRFIYYTSSPGTTKRFVKVLILYYWIFFPEFYLFNYLHATYEQWVTIAILSDLNCYPRK
ncbi:hypothetical protein DSUL_100210 [Desulfovibrionales bacterium]